MSVPCRRSRVWAVVAAALTLTTGVGATTGVGGPFPAGPGEATWEFRVLLDGREIGFHRFEVLETAETEQVDIEARFEVDIFFFTAYRYVHDNLETWRGDCLAEIESSTDDNGERYEIRGAIRGDGFALERPDSDAALETDCVRTFAYWNPEILQADRLLNAQTGEVKDITVERIGTTSFEVDGIPVASDEYVLSMGDGSIRLWYEQNSGQWLGLETRAKGDRTLRYEPTQLPSPPGERGGLAGSTAVSATSALSTP